MGLSIIYCHGYYLICTYSAVKTESCRKLKFVMTLSIIQGWNKTGFLKLILKLKFGSNFLLRKHTRSCLPKRSILEFLFPCLMIPPSRTIWNTSLPFPFIASLTHVGIIIRKLLIIKLIPHKERPISMLYIL